MRSLPRVLGAVTASYSVAIMVRPLLLARPCGLAGNDDRVDAPVALMIRAIGARDTAIGAAMLLAPRGPALRTAVAARVLADTSDVVLFGAGLPRRDRRPRIAGFAAFWAALCAASARWA
jgi:hypothetical protein